MKDSLFDDLAPNQKPQKKQEQQPSFKKPSFQKE